MPEIKIKIRDKRAGGTGTNHLRQQRLHGGGTWMQSGPLTITKTMRVNQQYGTYQDVVFTAIRRLCRCSARRGGRPWACTPGTCTPAGGGPAGAAVVTTAGGAPADPPESVYNQLMELIRGMGGASEEDIAKAVLRS